MKLEIKHLAPYLPYGLKAEMLDYKNDYVGRQFDKIIGIYQWSKNNDWCILTDGGSKPSLSRIKPILRPLSDITKEIEHNGERFVPMVELAIIANLDTTGSRLSSTESAYGIRCNIENDADSDKWVVLGFDAVNGFGEHYRPSNEWTIVQNQLELWQKLYSWHFDVFGLIDAGLAIDINTLNN